MLYTSFLVASFLTGVLSLVLAGVSFARAKDSGAHLRWAATCTAVGLWSLCLAMIISSTSFASALVWQFFLNVAAAFIPALYLDFIRHAFKANIHVWWIRICYLVSVIIVILATFPQFIIAMVRTDLFPVWPMIGYLYPVLPLYMTVIVIWIMIILFGRRKYAGGYERVKINYFLLATIIGFGSGMTNYSPQ